MGGEVIPLGERGQIAEEAQLPFVEGGNEPLEEEPAEQPGQRLHGQEEVGLAMKPSLKWTRSAGPPGRLS
jgi:hypothetical protein